MHLRALRNGVVAAVVTAILGFGVNALFADRSSESDLPPSSPATPTATAPACRPKATPAAHSALARLTGAFDDVWLDTADDGWAVGAGGTSDATSTAILAQWDGRRWRNSAGTPTSGTANALSGVDGTGPTDVWAVGWTSDGIGKDTLTTHYDGTSWTVAQSPTGARLYDVRALAPNDVWAVGSAGDPDFVDETAIALHWDGSTWSETTVPAGGGRSGLYAIAGTSDDLWAVGYHHHGPLVMHFNGKKWSSVDVTGAHGPLNGVSEADGAVWLAGSDILRGHGKTFAAVGTSPKGTTYTDVVARSATSAFAVGFAPAGAGGSRSLAIQIDGDVRRTAHVPAAGADALQVVTLLRGAGWLAGWHEAGKGQVPLVATLQGC